MPSFTHLHLHTLYSLLDGAIRIKDLLKTVQSKGMKSVAVTDHGNLFGAVDFYKKAKEAGVKPILGMEAYVANDRFDRKERVGRHLILLAKNQEGWANLRILSSRAFTEGFYYDPRIDKTLLRQHSKGLVGLTACLAGEIPRFIRHGDMDGARNAIREYREIFEPGSFFLEVQSNGMKEQLDVNAKMAQLSKDEGIPLVATADAHYIRREDAKAQEVLMCIASNKTFADPKRLRHDTDGLFVMGPDEMTSAMPGFEDAVERSAEIGELCNVELPLGKSFLPRFSLPEATTEDEHIERLAREGLDRRLREIDEKYRYGHDKDAYRARLEMELSVIRKMGFSGYFLIVQDFINWAKERDIPVGPGRGSGAGSIVAWSLRITDLDPIRWSLLFERFLNPERVSMPDFDIDFCQNRRDEVIGYVRKKYGDANVGQIITFGSLKPRSVIRDVVRVMGLPFSEGDRIAKLVPEPVQGKTPPLKECIENEPRLGELYERPTEISRFTDDKGRQQVVTTKDLLDIGMALEGLNRQAGLHAAGVVIADKPLWEYVPVYKDDKSEMLVSQFAKDEVEKAGLVKFDFLGLKTLTVIDDALRMVRANHPERKDFKTSDIPLDDPAVYELISRGDTAGVFQMESSGFTEMVVKMKPSRFEDVIAAGALYRPGPLDQKLEDGRTMVDVYIDRKHGRDKVTYDHPDLKPVLEPTYGVIVYQEQVMQISQVLAGYSLGRADLLRRAMGKKKAEEMAKERVGFLEGAAARGVDSRVANGIFDLMEKFAAYGFNKSHSAAYGLLTVQTAWLKAHYPVEFMAALISSEASNTDKVVLHVAEARADKIEVLQPDVNESGKDFSAFPPRGRAQGQPDEAAPAPQGAPTNERGSAASTDLERAGGPAARSAASAKDGARASSEGPPGKKSRIRFGLGAVRGVGDSAVEAILEARAKEGPFKSLFDFTSRVDARKINKKVVEALVKSGAFDFEGVPRWQLFHGIETAFNAGAAAQADRASGQASLFGAAPEVEAKPRYPKPGDMVGELAVEEWPERVRLAFEKEALGFYLTGHPLQGYEKEARRYASATCAAVAGKRHGDKVTVVGIVAALRERVTKEKGTRFGILTLEDTTGTVEVICWGGRPAQNGRPAQKGWADWELFAKSEEPILVHGEVRVNTRDEENPKAEITAIDVEPLSQVRSHKTTEIALRIDAERLTADRAGTLKTLLVKHPGNTAVTLRAVIPEQTETTISVPLKVQPADDLLEAARRLGFEVELR